MGAISWCSSLRILGEISSGPAALFGGNPCSLSTHSTDISIIFWVCTLYGGVLVCMASCFKQLAKQDVDYSGTTDSPATNNRRSPSGIKVASVV